MTTSIPDTVDLRKYIEMRDGRPHIRGRKVPVSFIASAEQANGLSIAELAYEFTLSVEQILAALLYYKEHKQAIDEQDAAEIENWNEMRALYGQKPEQS